MTQPDLFAQAAAAPTAPPDASTPDAPKGLGSIIGQLSPRLDAERIGTGTLAELRRMAWDEFPSAYWHFTLRHIPEAWRTRDGAPSQHLDRAWAAVLRAMAEGAPNPNAFGHSFGAALAETGYAEPRFVRLLRADGEDLAREMRTAALWLARAGTKANWTDPAGLMLGRIGRLRRAGETWLPAPETIVHSLARDYFRAQHSQS
ncbi:MAG: hypothetical protein KDC18_15245 [Alphaproteobacteria bacterium]|nr:hypothetical protein [Alphaproteobacteria bacterium]